MVTDYLVIARSINRKPHYQPGCNPRTHYQLKRQRWADNGGLGLINLRLIMGSLVDTSGDALGLIIGFPVDTSDII